MRKILFLAHRVPFPPNRGDKIRSYNLLKILAKTGEVHLGCFGDTDDDMGHDHQLSDMAKTHCVIKRDRSIAASALGAIMRGKAISVTAFSNPALFDYVRSTILEHQIDTIFVFSGQMAQYVPADFTGRVVVDFCDVDSAKFAAYAHQSHVLKALIYGREARLMRREEAAAAHRADLSFLISGDEANLFRSNPMLGHNAQVAVLGNGIDTAFYDPTGPYGDNPFAYSAGPNIVFTGQMDYEPNIAAVERAVNAIMPVIRAQIPNATFHVVGRAPALRVKRLDGVHGAKIWGEVPDVRPFLGYADLVLVPLTIARGIQNKVLEAMAMARPVVLSVEAATGIDAKDGDDFLIGNNVLEMADNCLRLCAAPDSAAAMGARARRYVQQHMSWAAIERTLTAALDFQHEEERRDVA